jgi:hypothetical protein
MPPPGGIRTHNPNKRAAAERFRPRSHRDRLLYCHKSLSTTHRIVCDLNCVDVNVWAQKKNKLNNPCCALTSSGVAELFGTRCEQ